LFFHPEPCFDRAMPLRPFAFLTLFALAGSAAAEPGERLLISGIEVHGVHGVSADELLRGIEFGGGRDEGIDAATLVAACQHLREQLAPRGVLHVSCDDVADDRGGRQLVIDIVEAGDGARLEYARVERGDPTRLAERSDRHGSDRAIDCARNCGIAGDRVDAFAQLARRDPGKNVCRAGLSGLDDTAAMVRRQAARLLQSHAADCVEHLGADRLIDASLRLLMRPSHGDRSSAMALLARLMADAPELDAQRRERVLVAASALAERSPLAATGGRARALIATLHEAPARARIGPQE
jgi:hypothetical protein